MDGEGYGGEPDELVWGHLYVTPDTEYTTNHVGGAEYTSDPMHSIGGSLYTDTVNYFIENQ